MRFVSTRSNNAAAKDFRDDLGGFAGTVHAVIGKLIGRKALGVERAEAGLVAEQRAAGHSHAAGEKNFDRGVEPENGNAGGAKKFGATGLRIGAAAESEHGAFLELGGAAECGAKLVGFDRSKGGLAEAFEHFGDGQTRSLFDAFVEIHEAPGELAGE